MLSATLYGTTGMEWLNYGTGGICLDGHTELHVVYGCTMLPVRYRDEIFDHIVRPFTGAMGEDCILLQDNGRPHIARATMYYLDQKGI